MNDLLELDDVRKSYDGHVAVAGVTFSVPPGSIFGLLGPNGAGKTTTIRMILDILAPDSGSVRMFGRPREEADLSRVGYLPEERGLYRKMTVLDQLLFLAEIRGIKRRAALPLIEPWLERTDLAPWTKRRIEELSKGMQQKVQLIGAVLHKPDLLILDEPFSGLDPLNQELFRELLTEYRDSGRTVVLSTHGMELAERMCDRICLISKGRAVLEGEIGKVKAGFGGNAYLITADGDLDRLREIPGVLQAAATGRSSRLLLAPEIEGADVLARAVEFLRVAEFRSEQPSLEQIFLQAVRHEA
jgi:ABC-2 type transport system ATP-binding protein